VHFLPVLRRELAVAARRTATYRQRALVAGLATGTVAVLFLFLPMTRLSGATVFRVIVLGGFLLSLLEGLRAAADSIAFERREGTLGLLLLTDLRGREIVLGKIAAGCVQSLTVVISMLPAFVLPLIIGGVSGGECLRAMLTFVSALFFSMAAGIFVSAWARHPLIAFLGAFLLLSALTLPAVAVAHFIAVPWLKWFGCLGGPVQMNLLVYDSGYQSSPAAFWLAFVTGAGLCLLLLAGAAWLLEHRPRLETSHHDGWFQRWLRPASGQSESWGGVSAKSSPSVWLAERTLPGQRLLWCIIGSGMLVSFLIGCLGGRGAVAMILLCEVFFAWFIKLWVAAVAPLSLNNAHRSGALELLLVTPVQAEELIRGQVDALYGYFIGPALVLAVGFPAFGLAGLALSRNTLSLTADASLFTLGIFWIILFVIDLHALAYAGLWFGLTDARVDRAISKTVFSVMVLPILTLIVPVVGLIGILGWPIFWINWASGRLNRRLREEAGASVALESGPSGWLPWSRRPAPP